MKRPTILATLALSSACAMGPRHIAPYAAKQRTFDEGTYAELETPAPGSIYASQQGLFEDNRAQRIGDIVVIQIDERETAQNQSNTRLKRGASADYKLTSAFGLMKKLQRNYPDLDPQQFLMALASNSSFNGSGSLQKSGKLTATLAVRVKKVMPNGDLYVEGTNVVMVSNEEHHLYVSGVVRRIDIDADNTVMSSHVANAEIEYIGRGDVTDQQRPGWGHRALTRGMPF